jgi:hypothetical protein
MVSGMEKPGAASVGFDDHLAAELPQKFYSC